MTWRPGAIVLARAANALFFIAVATYCFLAYSPFAYGQFIAPDVVPALRDFVAVSPWLFWAVVLTTILTVMPQLRGARGRGFVWTYVAAVLLAGVLVAWRPPLARVGNSAAALVLGLAALISPIWLALIDHVIWPSPRVRPLAPARTLTAAVFAAVLSWSVYAMAVPIRLAQAKGLDLPPAAIVIGLGSSLALHLYVFVAVFLAIAVLTGEWILLRRGGEGEYWQLVGLLSVCCALTLFLLVCSAIAFTGWTAWTCSIALAVAVAAVWADVARLTVAGHETSALNRAPLTRSEGTLDSLDVFCAPVAGIGSRRRTIALLIGLPFVAYALVEGVRQFDWNFLLQKLGVLIVWLMAFAAAVAVVSRHRFGPSRAWVVRVVPVGVLLLYQLAAGASAYGPIDRYVAVDISFRLMRDANTAHSSETVDYYQHLRANTLLAPSQVHAPAIDFVPVLGPATGPKPHIFLIIVDSMRRDYLSPYNPRVTFTPRIGELAAESYVFKRAFTRYSGTALAIPSIWTGGMVPHLLEPDDFLPRNTLQKLLDANGYLRVMDVDHIVRDLVPPDGFIRLDEGKGTMEVDVCGTMDELAETLKAHRDRPMFFYSLPQNVHIAVATRRPVPPGESYPAPFYDRIASSLARVDACVGGFIDFLKRENLYDESIIILTADHGDSLGEEGRWGHAYFMYPEVMNIPLIVHLPSRLSARVRTDLDAVAFSTDITPSLYALLGYQPRDLGPLFGRPLFAARESDTNLRRRDGFLLASSYGAVYGVLRQNGRRMHVVDAVDGREYAFDLSRSIEATAVTPVTTTVSRHLIDGQLQALASVYRYRNYR